MHDAFKMILISLVTSIAVLFTLGETMLRLQPGPPEQWGLVATVPSHNQAVAEASALPARQADQRFAPNLVGTSVDEARQRWQAQGIGVLEYSQREDGTAMPGIILEQIPAPGTLLQEREIRVVVARAAEKIAVPEFVGQSHEDARQAALKSGFELSAPAFVLDKERDGVVLAQEPAAGAKTVKGTQIKLSVAQRALVVPEVVGKRLTQARSLLERAGFQVGDVKTREHPEYSGGRILEQKPAPGEALPRGTTIDLVVVAPN